jgi:hypothetical protein
LASRAFIGFYQMKRDSCGAVRELKLVFCPDVMAKESAAAVRSETKLEWHVKVFTVLGE